MTLLCQDVPADSDMGRELMATCPGLFVADEAGDIKATNARGHEMTLEKVGTADWMRVRTASHHRPGAVRCALCNSLARVALAECRGPYVLTVMWVPNQGAFNPPTPFASWGRQGGNGNRACPPFEGCMLLVA
jgi:hypothetical protein